MRAMVASAAAANVAQTAAGTRISNALIASPRSAFINTASWPIDGANSCYGASRTVKNTGASAANWTAIAI